MARILVVPDGPVHLDGPVVEMLVDDDSGSWDGVCSCGWRVVLATQRFLDLDAAVQVAELHLRDDCPR